MVFPKEGILPIFEGEPLSILYVAQSHIVGGQHKPEALLPVRDLTFELLVEPGKESDAPPDILDRVKDVLHAKGFGRFGHELHQSGGAGKGNRGRIKTRLLVDDGRYQPPVPACVGGFLLNEIIIG